MLGFPIGLILPVIPWALNKYKPMKLWTLINIPLLLYYNGSYYPQNYIWTPLLAGFIFNYYIFRNHQDWWQKYNYVFAAAASAGFGICMFVYEGGKFGELFPAIEWTGNEGGDLYATATC